MKKRNHLKPDNILKILSSQDPHSIWLRSSWEPPEVRQQPEDPLQRGLQQVRGQLGLAEERREPDQGLAVVRAGQSRHHPSSATTHLNQRDQNSKISDT